MNHLLHNPVFHALATGDAAFSHGDHRVKYFDEEVSPFVGFADDVDDGFQILHQRLPMGRKILYANPEIITIPQGWKTLAVVHGLQFVLDDETAVAPPTVELTKLSEIHVPEMIALTALTKPGPFSKRTIEFGHYFGIFDNGRLAAMTGQRLHVGKYSEISAVCTHPDYLGRGYAASLLLHQISLIREMGQTPFLHVRADNARAIGLYERLGFKVSRPMNFYFLKSFV